jgi:signal transduction histidine kinase
VNRHASRASLSVWSRSARWDVRDCASVVLRIRTDSWLSNIMSFGKQLLFGISAVIAVMMFCAAMSLATLWASRNETSEITSELLEQLETTQRLAVLSERLIASARGYMLTVDARERRLVDEVANELSQQLKSVTNEARRTLRMSQLVAVRLATERYLGEVYRVTSRSSVSELVYERDVQPAGAELTVAVRRLLESERRRAEQLTQRSGQRVQLAGIILVVGSGLGALIGVVLAVLVSRRLFGEYSRGQQTARAAAQAARARKELLDMASHDLRSPLHSIMLTVDVMRHEHGGSPQLDVLEHSAQRMQKLVEGLLDASEAETTGLILERQHTTISKLFQSTIEMFTTQADRAGVRLVVHEAPTDLIELDCERVLQILSNLVSNALSFTPRDGEITLRATRLVDSIRISVTDTGPGIPEEERTALFQSFYQAHQGRDQKRSRRGSVGLGLYIARSLVLAHGGRIGVDSQLGSGSTFWFELPAALATPSVNNRCASPS